MLLEVLEASVVYTKVRAVRSVSLKASAGGIVSIVGANGAGKSSLLRAISGLVPLSEGEIRFESGRIDGLPADRVAARGIGHVPEGRRVFPDMTVDENLRTGAFLRHRHQSAAVQRDLASIYERFPQLAQRRGQNARTLSGGEQQMLAIGRALMLAPRLLLLDEPSMGLAPVIVEKISHIIAEIGASGVPVILVEQNAEMALELADYAYVLESGCVTLEGPAQKLRGDPHVRRAYLGG